MRHTARELWHQKPGPRAPKPVAAPLTRRAIVNGLDRREMTVGVIITVVDVLLAYAGYRGYQHASTKALRSEATSFLIASLVGAAILAFGLVLRRRALLGFACFMVGLEFFNYRLYPGALLYLAIGGWLIFRVTQKQKMDRAAGLDARSLDTRPGRGGTSSRGPKPSKRYTPPRNTAAGRRR